jgi:hypothetical protein
MTGFACNKENNRDELTPSKKGPKTKAQTLVEQADSIAKISDNYARSREAQESLIKHQTDLVQLQKLKQGLELGLLSQEEFNARARALLL